MPPRLGCDCVRRMFSALKSGKGCEQCRVSSVGSEHEGRPEHPGKWETEQNDTLSIFTNVSILVAGEVRRLRTRRWGGGGASRSLCLPVMCEFQPLRVDTVGLRQCNAAPHYKGKACGRAE
ncbi:hypothetical protein E2C01_042085 [Portunus trituberculatus]|uniref:Uncharacterized protein n=1 Tax=Portunus trituberculatus TaxID=210409 RepID=A0A5B7FSF6_PORTR|nr:hypothetical protein [Portunus trituberculatus]